MDRAACRQELDRLLQSELECARRLADALEREQTALAERDADTLPQCVADKQRWLEELQSLDHARGRVVRDTAHAEDRAGVEACLAWCDPTGDLALRWQQLLELVTECRDRNLANGNIVEQNRMHAERAIAILRGQNPDTQVYDPTGRSVTDSRSRTIGKG